MLEKNKVQKINGIIFYGGRKKSANYNQQQEKNLITNMEAGNNNI